MRRWRARLADQEGMSLMEIVVVVALLGIVGTMIAQSMLSSIRISTSGEDRSFTLNDTRTALEQVERDVRAANPIDLPPAGDTSPAATYYDTHMSFSIYCAAAGVGSCGSDHFRHVTWEVLPGTYTLHRLEGAVVVYAIGPAGPNGFAANQQRDAVVNPASRPVFQYYDAAGNLLDTSTTAADQFRQSAEQVRITLVVNEESGSAPGTIDLTTTATLRNFNGATK